MHPQQGSVPQISVVVPNPACPGSTFLPLGALWVKCYCSKDQIYPTGQTLDIPALR